jgi:predicted RNA binding protein YcfA (HicA-like mRNA interferase family)
MADYTEDVRRILAQNGFVFARRGKGDHVIWKNSATGRTVSVDGKIKSRHSANAALKEAGLPKAF